MVFNISRRCKGQDAHVLIMGNVWCALLRKTTCFVCCTISEGVSYGVYIKSRLPVKRAKMGRRKSKRKAPPKKKMTGPLDTQFTCPFCNHEKSCEVKLYVV